MVRLSSVAHMQRRRMTAALSLVASVQLSHLKGQQKRLPGQLRCRHDGAGRGGRCCGKEEEEGAGWGAMFRVVRVCFGARGGAGSSTSGWMMSLSCWAGVPLVFHICRCWKTRGERCQWEKGEKQV